MLKHLRREKGDDSFIAFNVIKLTANLNSSSLSISFSAYLSSAVTCHYVATVEKLIAAEASPYTKTLIR